MIGGLQFVNSIILIGLLIVEAVLIGVNDHHRVFYSTSNLMVLGALDRHVCDKIRDLTHLTLGILDLLSIRIYLRPIESLRVEVLKLR